MSQEAGRDAEYWTEATVTGANTNTDTTALIQ